jgi:hypothetical protein
MAVPFASSSPGPEVPEKAQRRKFSAKDYEADYPSDHSKQGARLWIGTFKSGALEKRFRAFRKLNKSNQIRLPIEGLRRIWLHWFPFFSIQFYWALVPEW